MQSEVVPYQGYDLNGWPDSNDKLLDKLNWPDWAIKGHDTPKVEPYQFWTADKIEFRWLCIGSHPRKYPGVNDSLKHFRAESSIGKVPYHGRGERLVDERDWCPRKTDLRNWWAWIHREEWFWPSYIVQFQLFIF